MLRMISLQLSHMIEPFISWTYQKNRLDIFLRAKFDSIEGADDRVVKNETKDPSQWIKYAWTLFKSLQAEGFPEMISPSSPRFTTSVSS
jgi:hypothetical protein